MPVYCHRCTACGAAGEGFRPMACAAETPRCGQCGGPTVRDYRAERASVGAYHEFASAGLGVPDVVAQRAFRVPRKSGGHDLYQRMADGSRGEMLHLPGETMDPQTGRVRIRSRAEKRRAVRERGMVDYSA